MLVFFSKMNPRSLKFTGALVLVLMFVLGGAMLLPGVAMAQPSGFSDVPDSYPYHVQIETLARLGIITGFSDGTFHPGDPVTRQQFAKMVILAMRIEVSEDDKSTFTDVKKSSDVELYPDNYVAAAAREKIVTGYQSASGAYFKPDASITLSQMITMGTRACERPLFVPPESYRSAWGNFDPVHGVIARVAQYNGLLREIAPKGLKSLSPWSTATRGQAAALLFNVMGTDGTVGSDGRFLPVGLNGRFLGTSDDLVKMFRDATDGNDGKFTIALPDLAKLYVKYGKRFGIRADMAWAQMIHETGYGQFGGDVKPEQNNMVGIGATGGGVPGNSFATAELGVIAHYAHLAWYLYPDHMSDPYCVLVDQPADGPITVPGDPRHFVQSDGSAHKGNVRTVYDLSGKWAPGSTYGSAIQALASKIQVTCGLW